MLLRCTKPFSRCVQRQSLSTAMIHKSLRIVFGSQTGTAEAFANDLEFDASELHYGTEIIDASTFSLESLQKSNPHTVTALIMACYGEGEPTDNAKKFVGQVMGCTDANILAGSQFSVFGLGNSQCFKDRFNVVGKALDAKLQALGGVRVLPLGLGDASSSQNKTFSEWKKSLFASLEAIPASKVINSTGIAAIIKANIPVESVDISTGALPLSQRQLAMAPADRPVFVATVSETRELFRQTDEFSSAVEVSFQLPSCSSGPGVCSAVVPSELTRNLQSGDHVGIFAPNSAQVVQKFAVMAGLSAQHLREPISNYLGGSSEGVTLEHALTWHLALTSAVPLAALKVLHRWTRDSLKLLHTSEHLSQLILNYDKTVISHRQCLDITTVLDMLPPSARSALAPSPAHIACAAEASGCAAVTSSSPLAALLKTLPPISPRLYSLTHDPLTHRDSASLLSRLLRFRDLRLGSQRIVNGHCSSYLCDRLRPHDKVHMFFRESNFHLPADPATPVIMIGGGSGLAPFISFLEARSRMVKTNPTLGPAVLYYGCRDTDEYIHRAELVQYLADKALTKLVVSFSLRNDWDTAVPLAGNEQLMAGTRNITDVVLEHSDQLVPMVGRKAHIFVCGGAGNFGKAVRQAVNTLAVKSQQLSSAVILTDDDDHHGVRHLVAAKQYFEDLAD